MSVAFSMFNLSSGPVPTRLNASPLLLLLVVLLLLLEALLERSKPGSTHTNANTALRILKMISQTTTDGHHLHSGGAGGGGTGFVGIGVQLNSEFNDGQVEYKLNITTARTFYSREKEREERERKRGPVENVKSDKLSPRSVMNRNSAGKVSEG